MDAPTAQRLDDLVMRAPAPAPVSDRTRRLEELSVAAGALGKLSAYFGADLSSSRSTQASVEAAARLAVEIVDVACGTAKKPA